MGTHVIVLEWRGRERLNEIDEKEKQNQTAKSQNSEKTDPWGWGGRVGESAKETYKVTQTIL